MAGAFYEDVYDCWDYGAKVPDMVNTTMLGITRSTMRLATFGLDPLDPTDNIYYLNVFEKTVRQKALFGEMTFDLTDKLVRHRWRSMVRVRPP